MLRKNCVVNTVACAAVMFVTACGGGSEGITPPPVDQKETVVVSANVQVNGLTIIMSASAQSSKVGPIMDPSKYSWTVDGAAKGTGNPLSLPATPGTHNVCGTAAGSDPGISSTPVCYTVTVNAANLACTIVVSDINAPNGESVPSGVRLSVFRGTDTVSVIPNGSDCSLVTPFVGVTDSVEYSVDAVDVTHRLYHPKSGWITAAEFKNGVGIILHPFGAITVPQGFVYAGAQVQYDIKLAFVRGFDGLTFYPSDSNTKTAVINVRLGAHKDSLQPLAFRNDPGDIVFSASDSAQIMAMANKHYYAMSFYPVNPNAVPDTLVLKVAAPSSLAGSGELGDGGGLYRKGGVYRGGSLNFVNPGYPQKYTGTFWHELFHFLGIDHGCGFPSTQNQFCASATDAGVIPNVPTIYDVVYPLEKDNSIRLEWKYGTRHGIVDSYRGELKYMLKVKNLPTLVLQS